MEDFAFPWDHPPPKPKSSAAGAKTGSTSTAPKARRSSILKGSSAPSTTKAGTSSSSSERNALQDLNNVNTNNVEKESKKMSRRSSKRVSFSASKIVKEFEVGSVGTVWNTTYEEEHGQSTLQSTSSAESVVDENTPAADVPDGGASRKRRILQPETSDEVSPSKQTPLRLEIPARSSAEDGDDSGNPYLPWGEKGGDDLMLESPLVHQQRNTFLSSLAPAGQEMCKVNTQINRGSPSPRRMRLAVANHDLDKSTFHIDANDVSSASELEASTFCGANKTTRSDFDMDETRAVGPALGSQSSRIAPDRTMLFNKTGTDLLDMTSCVQNEEARDVSEIDESSGELSLTTVANPSNFLKSLGTATAKGSVSSMDSTLVEGDGTDYRCSTYRGCLQT